MKSLNLYLLTQNENTGFDTFDSCIVAAEDVDQANDFIHDFMESDPHNYRDSRGYSYVSEEDRLEHLYSDTAGIIYKGIYYSG